MGFMHGDGAGDRGSGTTARSLGWRCLLTYDISLNPLQANPTFALCAFHGQAEEHWSSDCAGHFAVSLLGHERVVIPDAS